MYLRPLGDVLSSSLVIFPATLASFCQSGSHHYVRLPLNWPDMTVRIFVLQFNYKKDVNGKNNLQMLPEKWFHCPESIWRIKLYGGKKYLRQKSEKGFIFSISSRFAISECAFVFCKWWFLGVIVRGGEARSISGKGSLWFIPAASFFLLTSFYFLWQKNDTGLFHIKDVRL